MERIAGEPCGLVVILRQHETAREIMESVRSLARGGGQAPGTSSLQPGGTVLRTYGIGAQILQDLGVTRMRVLSAPKQMLGISAFGLEISEYVD
jgi:3,4-dihydroxy 2-butanone 4-phosphate synthase/GTP cyclohydrolase II